MSKKKTRTEKQQTEFVRKKCVTLAKFLTRKISNFTCEYCNKKEPSVKTHGSHIYSEGVYKSMSADIDNILCLCYMHHLGGYMDTIEPSWHKNPIEMVNWFNEKYPERAKLLKERSRQTKQLYLGYWENKLEELKKLETKINKNEEKSAD